MKACGAQYGANSPVSCSFSETSKPPNAGTLNRSPAPKLNGQAYTNIGGGKWRGAIRVMRSGMFIPTEMTRAATRAAFEAGASEALESLARQLFTPLAG